MKWFGESSYIEEIKKTHIKIMYMSYAEVDQRWHHPPSKLNANLFYLCDKGEGELWCDGKHVRMTPGNVYCMPAGTSVGIHCSDYMAKLYFFGTLYDAYNRELPIAPAGCYVLEKRKKQIGQMYKLLKNPSYQNAFDLHLRAEQIAFEIFSRYQQPTPIKHYSDPIRQTLQIINGAPHLSKTAVSLAADVGTTPHRLRALFAKEMKTTVGEYVRLQVLNAAAEDLRDERLSVREISEKYGFCDQFYFSRMFTAHFGISPLKYQKSSIF